jgi:hypothetical protein
MARNDADLIELSGYWVYDIMKNGLKKNPLTVNGRLYTVIDIRKNGNHGLDAITVVNELTGEEITSMIAKSKDLAQTWEGQTRAAYDDFVMIEERYQKDMLYAITGYKEIITLVAQKVGDVRNAKQLKEVEKI